ncbi:MAG: 23S rRNA (adenine(2030)-N(6))-methyltransferase RlmJ [Hyphomicrobiaceae bacterium]
MNYRHIYHAGNFADVVKHAALALIIDHLRLKPAPFRVIDTHAGIGLYDLSAIEAEKTGEWRDGIGRLLSEPLPAPVAELLTPYLAAVMAENPGWQSGTNLPVYPGSPVIARNMLRSGDALVVNELHPEDFESLRMTMARDKQTKVMNQDGWTALKGLLPPKERRGVILIDPPFEEPGELARLTQALTDAVRRFATGTFVLWYPIKDQRPVFAFRRELVDGGFEKLLSVELLIKPTTGEGLAGCGLAILNPPYGLKEKLDILLPYFAEIFAQAPPGASSEVRWLATERARAS